MTLGRLSPLRVKTLVLAAASIAAVGVVALLGWILDAPSLAAWTAGTVPMAPATAVLAMMVGAAFWFSARGERRRPSLKLAAALASAGIAASSLILVLRLTVTYWPAELLGLRLSGPAALDPTTGFVSPITAAGFLLVNAALLLALAPGRRTVASWLRRVAGGVVAAAGFVLLLVALFGPPLLSSVGILPVAVNSSLVLLMMGLALLVAGRGPAGVRPAKPEAIWRGRTVYASLFAAVTVLAVVGAYAYYRAEEQALQSQAEHELDTISQLKVSQLQEWRQERLADAGLLYNDPLVAGLARRLVTQPDDAAARREFEAWWHANQAHLQSDAFALTDVQGRTILSAPSAAASPSVVVAAELAVARRTGKVSVLDFYLDERDRRVYLATLVPVREQAPSGRTIGILMIRLEPDRFLYPFIALSLSRSTTAETLLVRRDGEFVQFLSPLKFDPVAPLRKRIGLDHGQVLAVKAVLGQAGLVEGLDDRGEPVIGVVRAIPGSPWFLIARTDTAEFRADLWRRLWQVITFATIALFAMAAGLGFVWRDQSARFYRSQANLADELRHSEERYRRYIESATDTVIELTPAGVITFVSPNWLHTMGEPGTDAIGKSFEHYVHPDDLPVCRAYIEQTLAHGTPPKGIEYRSVRRDGAIRWHSVRGAALRDPEGNIVGGMGIARDITERWTANNQLRSLVLEKEALLREVHHRVKNNLQVITSLLRLEAERAGQPHTVQVLRDMQGRIFAMASLHESLYRSNQFERVDLSDYIRRVCTQLLHSASVRPGAIRLGFDLEPVYLEVHQAIPCGLLVNELVSNSLKHGFPDGRTGAIRVELHVTGGGRLELSVRDTGVGLPVDFDSRRNGSLGLQLVADLAHQLHGALDIAPAPGAAFCVVFTPDLAHSGGVTAKSA